MEIVVRFSRVLGFVVLLCLITQPVRAQAAPSPGYVPPNGVVPDSITAVRVAVAILSPIYGAKQIRGEHPFHSTLKDGVWIVRGSLPRGWIGGVAEIHIAKQDGRILAIYHGK